MRSMMGIRVIWLVLAYGCKDPGDAKGLLILGISLDTERKLLDDYLQEMEIPRKMACSLKGWGDETVKLYRINATPSTWLIDRQGILRHINLKGEKLTRAITELL